MIRIKKEKDSYETGLSLLGILVVRTVPGYSSLVSEVIMGCSSKETEGDTFGPQVSGWREMKDYTGILFDSAFQFLHFCFVIYFLMIFTSHSLSPNRDQNFPF